MSNLRLWVGLFWGFFLVWTIFQSYRNFEAGDTCTQSLISLKWKWRDRELNPWPLAPQAKSLTTPSLLLPASLGSLNTYSTKSLTLTDFSSKCVCIDCYEYKKYLLNCNVHRLGFLMLWNAEFTAIHFFYSISMRKHWTLKNLTRFHWKEWQNFSMLPDSVQQRCLITLHFYFTGSVWRNSWSIVV